MTSTSAYLPMRAFNIVPGTAFTPAAPGSGDAPADEVPIDGGIWVAMTVSRSVSEEVYIWARRADYVVEKPGDGVDNTTMLLDYNDMVAVLGICVNPMDLDDNDWGN